MGIITIGLIQIVYSVIELNVTPDYIGNMADIMSMQSKHIISPMSPLNASVNKNIVINHQLEVS